MMPVGRVRRVSVRTAEGRECQQAPPRNPHTAAPARQLLYSTHVSPCISVHGKQLCTAASWCAPRSCAGYRASRDPCSGRPPCLTVRRKGPEAILGQLGFVHLAGRHPALQTVQEPGAAAAWRATRRRAARRAGAAAAGREAVIGAAGASRGRRSRTAHNISPSDMQWPVADLNLGNPARPRPESGVALHGERLGV